MCIAELLKWGATQGNSATPSNSGLVTRGLIGGKTSVCTPVLSPLTNTFS